MILKMYIYIKINNYKTNDFKNVYIYINLNKKLKFF